MNPPNEITARSLAGWLRDSLVSRINRSAKTVAVRLWINMPTMGGTLPFRPILKIKGAVLQTRAERKANTSAFNLPVPR